MTCIDRGNWLERTPFLLIFIHWLGRAQFMQQLYCSFESKYSLLEIGKKPRHPYILLRLPKQKRFEGWPTNPTIVINLAFLTKTVELKNEFLSKCQYCLFSSSSSECLFNFQTQHSLQFIHQTFSTTCTNGGPPTNQLLNSSSCQ